MKKLIFILFCTSVNLTDALRNQVETIDARMNFPELAKLHGHPCEAHDVVTQDGYILKLFHIPGKRGLPILLMHGILDSSDTWIITGKKSLAVALANTGHDIWFGNSRGNQYSRRHVSLNPDLDDIFWDFSFHEHGHYDLPAVIDTILVNTGAAKLNAIGHSQGNGIFYVLGATRPEYNDKVNLLIALAPVSFLHHMGPPWGPVIKLFPEMGPYYKSLGMVEFLNQKSLFYKLLKLVCHQPIGYEICVQGVVFTFFGKDIEELPPAIWPTIFQYIPHGTSIKNLIHYGQVIRTKTFSHFDYGVRENLALYNSSSPPEYDHSRVSMRVVLLVGRNDMVCTPFDVAILRRKLPNVMSYAVINKTEYSHLDFVWAEHNDIYLFPLIFEMLKKYDLQ
ncbi:unnamed protein product [Parnassius apollo]|uniref:Lipase n=1 Tax=Parnassius apollo TaxID=110799 RepID=A0A8S3XRF2_PARAO|nr:unnamed protein product [Parnassius apollo]